MNIVQFKTSKELENQLATQIAAKLDLAIKKNGKAHLLVSGGTSPIGMFHLLSLKQLDWKNVTIGLVDERFVPNSSEASNERLVKENLMINEAQQAQFIPMVHALENELENLAIANASYKQFHQAIDVCVLGMGEDGHTASLFPNDKASQNNLLSDNISLLSTLSPNEPKHRISCSKTMLLSSDFIYIMLLGESKKIVLQQASAQKLPISYFTETENKVVDIYYSAKK
jgi:6-phosphogluconolactonase